MVTNNNVTMQKNIFPAFVPYVLPVYPKLHSTSYKAIDYVVLKTCQNDLMSWRKAAPWTLYTAWSISLWLRFISLLVPYIKTPTKAVSACSQAEPQQQTKDKDQNTSLNRDPLCHKHASLFRSVKQFTEMWYSLFSYRCKWSINVDYRDTDQH